MAYDTVSPGALAKGHSILGGGKLTRKAALICTSRNIYDESFRIVSMLICRYSLSSSKIFAVTPKPSRSPNFSISPPHRPVLWSRFLVLQPRRKFATDPFQPSPDGPAQGSSNGAPPSNSSEPISTPPIPTARKASSNPFTRIASIFSQSRESIHEDYVNWRTQLQASRWRQIKTGVFFLLLLIAIWAWWTDYLSPDSAFGVIRRTIKYIEQDPDLSEAIGPSPRWYTTKYYTQVGMVPNVLTRLSRPKEDQILRMWITFWISGKRRAEVNVMMHEDPQTKRMQCHAIAFNFESGEKVSREKHPKQPPLF